ncbi:MAG: EamA family transporter [candidate division Zixibacteria bacterium]|nr:EamA family transporter [candidate division Zixibacteria bacterium]
MSSSYARSSNFLPSFLFAVLCLIWGSTWLGIKIGLEDSPPFLSAGFRFLIATVFLFIWAKKKGIKFSDYKSQAFKILIPGFFMYYLSYSLVYWGEQYINSGLTAVLFATFPFFVAIFATLLLKEEKLNWFRLFGLIIGFSGILLIFWESLSLKGENLLRGMLGIVLSAVCSAYASVRVKRDLYSVESVVISVFQMGLGTLLLLGSGFLSERITDFKLTYKSVGALLYLSFFGSAFAFMSYYWLLKRIEVTKLSLIAFITPIVALILGWLVLGESISGYLISGTVLVIIGIWLVSRYGIASRKQ